MKRFILLITVLLAASACRQAEDTRYFAPAVQFGSDRYAVSAGDGGLDIDLHLSRPAPQALHIGLNVSSSLEEGLQYRVASRTVDIAPGQQDATVHVDLVDDEIWVESAWIDVLLKPGERYTVDPEKNSTARVDISKTIDMPIFRLNAPEAPVVTNPFLAETIHFQLTADRATTKDLEVVLDFGGLELGKDYRIAGSETAGFTYPAGARSHLFSVEILKKDQSGYDREAALAVVAQKGRYTVDPEGSSVSVHLSDPVVPLNALWRTPALNGGTGYRWNQAIKTPEGEWEGNTTVDMALSAEGSNYIQNQRSLWTHSSFNCPATASPSHPFRLTDLCPKIRYPSEVAILDYGANESYRSFFPCDSLLRFVADKPDTPNQGSLAIHSPRRLQAYIGDRAAWGNTWKDDAKKTGGDMAASTDPAIRGQVTVTLEKLEGTYDLDERVLYVTAWFSSEDARLMEEVDFTKWSISKEDGLWKVEYKIWPR
jgi:hypothetical protein